MEVAQQAASKRDTAQATLTRDTAAVTAAEEQVGVLQAQLAKAKATLQHDQAVQEQAQLNVGYTNIVAPIDGVVGNRSLRVGEYVQAGTQLMAVVPLAAVYVVANFEETQLAGIRKRRAGQTSWSIPIRRRPSKAMSTASRRPAARNSRCCRPTTPPATSPRSCSASR